MSNAAVMMIERLARGRAQESVSRHAAPLDILVVDDDQATRLSLVFALSDAGHRVSEAADGEEAMALSSERTYDVALLDVRLPKVDGLTIFRRLRAHAPSTAVILMTAFATIADAVASLREGAYDYVTKPFDPEELTLRVIGHISEHVSLKRELEEARRVVASREVGSPIVGHTPAMVQLVERVNTVAQSDAPVVVYGESGTGKGLVAHTLHARGPRKAAPFVRLDCGASPEAVLERELFGDDAGDRRRPGLLELAEDGTLLLHDVAALPLAMQTKLVRVLEDGVLPVGPSGASIPVRARIVSTTQQDLKALVGEAKLKAELFLRLNVLDVRLPPLRERKADIPLLLAHFLRRFCRGRVPPGIGPRAWEAIVQYSFPGNVRELAHAVERAVALARGSEIDVEHLPEAMAAAQRTEEKSIAPLASASRSFEREHIVRALERVRDVRRAAALLGLSVRTLRQKMQRHGIAERG